MSGELCPVEGNESHEYEVPHMGADVERICGRIIHKVYKVLLCSDATRIQP